MNNLLKSTLRFNKINALNIYNNFSRSINHLPKHLQIVSHAQVIAPKSYSATFCKFQPSGFINYGCSTRHIHSKGERELVEFLTEEIVAERKAHKVTNVPNTLGGFSVKIDGSDVILTKKSEEETIVITFNVNHSVDTEQEPEANPNADKVNMGEMRSKPQFEVVVVKGDLTLSFTCSYLNDGAEDDEYNDVFNIDEMCIYQGEWNSKVYAVAGDVLDGYMYDLLLNYLDEKGVNNEFLGKLSDLATAHEHILYVGLLESLSKFAVKKIN